MVIVRLRTKKGVRTTTISDTNIYKYTKSRAGIYSKKDKVKKNNKISYEKLSNKEKNTKGNNEKNSFHDCWSFITYQI